MIRDLGITMLQNVSGIDFESCADNANHVQDLRCLDRTPSNLLCEPLFNIYGNLFDGPVKVLEIGCGCGRNANFFKDKPTVEYFAFDTSATSLAYFRAEKFPDRFYVAEYPDDIILAQQYDLIFSTFVLQHIGIFDGRDTLDAVRLSKLLMPTLVIGGYWLAFELHQGQNNWNPGVWRESFGAGFEWLLCQDLVLDGCEKSSPHTLMLARKLDIDMA